MIVSGSVYIENLLDSSSSEVSTFSTEIEACGDWAASWLGLMCLLCLPPAS